MQHPSPQQHASGPPHPFPPHPFPQLAGGQADRQPGENKPPQLQPAVTMTNGTNNLTSEYWIRIAPPLFGSLTTPNRYFASRGDPH
jgi:hypothetical protein